MELTEWFELFRSQVLSRAILFVSPNFARCTTHRMVEWGRLTAVVRSLVELLADVAALLHVGVATCRICVSVKQQRHSNSPVTACSQLRTHWQFVYLFPIPFCQNNPLFMEIELVRNLVAHGDAREGKWRRYWRMEGVASTLTPPPNVVYPALLKLMRTPRLPAVDWNNAPTDLNGLVRFGERRNMVFARVPSRSARAIQSAPHYRVMTHKPLIFRDR